MSDADFYGPVRLPCDSIARFDADSGISFRCETCWAVVGSIGMPGGCREEIDKWDAYESAGMWKWDYKTGEPLSLHKNERN